MQERFSLRHFYRYLYTLRVWGYTILLSYKSQERDGRYTDKKAREGSKDN